MTDSTRWKATVYVGGLAPQATAQSLHDAFLPFGEIVDVSLPRSDAGGSSAASKRNPLYQNQNQEQEQQQQNGDSHQKKNGSGHRGFAYVEFEDADDAREAIDNMDQAEFFGRVLRVNAAKPPKSSSEGLGSKTAVWEQESWLAENAVSEEDRAAADAARAAGSSGAAGGAAEGGDDRPFDPMQGLEGLDVAGPKPE